MASEIRLPELAENADEGTVTEVKVDVGDEVSEGQDLLEVDVGKASAPVPSPVSGKITEVLIKQGDTVQTDQVLFRVEATNGAAKAKEPARPRPPEKKPEKAEPAPNGAPEAAAEAKPKPPAEPPPPRPSEPQAAPAPPTARAEVAVTDRSRPPVPAAPSVRQLARELGVEIGNVPGSGRNGRVTTEDVKAYVKRSMQGGGPAAGAGVQAPPLPDFGKWGEVERKPLDVIRRETAKQMALAWALIPHVTQHDEADVTELESFRKSQPKDQGPRMTVTAFALKAVAIALKEFPQFNSTLDLANNQLILKKYVHIGLAVDTDRGLLVPVIRDVDKKSVHELAAEMAAVAQKARERKISAADLAGGTFTITNLGGIGGTGFTPIVNYPEVAILGMSRSKWQPVVHNGQVVTRFLLPLSLSYDHRVIDGAAAARFTRRVAEMLENPMVMLLYA